MKAAEGVAAFIENLGFGELLLILIIALVVFGPKKLPDLGRSLGSALREFRKAAQELSAEVARAAADDDPGPRPAPPSGQRSDGGSSAAH